MGNSEVGHLTIGAGRRLYQDLMRVNKAIEDGSFFENPALRAAFERGRRVHLLGLVSHGGVHSHIDHVQALLRFAPEKTWIHAFTDGRDVSPTSAVRDLAELPLDRIATVVGRYYAMDRDQRWERTQRAFDAIVERRGPRSRDDPRSGRRRATTPASPTSSSSRSSSTARRGSSRATPRSSSTSVPTAARQLTRLLLDAGFDVTTMTRYACDLDTPVVFAEQDVPDTIAEVLAAARAAPAARRRDREVRPRHLLLQRRPRGGVAGGDAIARAEPARRAELRPEAGDVRRRGRRARSSTRSATATRSASSTSRTPTWSATPARSRPSSQAVETADRCLGRVVERVERARRRLPRHGRPRQRRADARGGRRLARTRRTRRTPSRSS